MEEENRFDHSIGAYYLMCKIINNIEKKLALQGIKVKEEEKEIAKIAILLHDIGHGAYSHTLEKITGYSHEKRSIDIVKDKNTQIHNILKKYYGEEFTKKVGEFLENVYEHKTQEAPLEEIRLENKRIKLESLFAYLISNNIDADRLDYLVRDSKKAGFKVLTDVDELINSFEFVLDIDKIIVAIPEEKKILLDMAILERTRNYRDIYFCAESIIGDKVLDFLLDELAKNPKEVPEDTENVLKTFFTNKKAKISTKEYIKLTETPIKLALDRIRENTQNEMLTKLTDIKYITNSYQQLNTDKKESYIRYLLHKAIPEIPKETKGIISETRGIKPYKSNESENINVITNNGIEDYKDVKQELIKLEPFNKTVVAISYEMIRLELGISKEEFDKNYRRTIDEVVSTITKSKDEFELRYVITKGSIDAQKIREKIEEKYEIVDSAKYMSSDMYYDNPQNYELLEKKEALRVRRGTTFHESKETYKFKSTRATYKKYKRDVKSGFTVRRKEEEIGTSDRIEDYEEFLTSMGINKKTIAPILEVNNLRKLFTVKINDVLMDISINTAYYQNQIYEMIGNAGIIEVRPRENKISDRLSMLEIRQFLEENFKELTQFSSNANVYEIGVLDTYEKYKKGYIINSETEEYEKLNKQSAKKLEEISEKVKKKTGYEWLNEIPSINGEHPNCDER